MAIDGIAVVVDPSNTVEDLTKQQLSDLYDGKVTNWKDVGLMLLEVVGRESVPLHAPLRSCWDLRTFVITAMSWTAQAQ